MRWGWASSDKMIGGRGPTCIGRNTQIQGLKTWGLTRALSSAAADLEELPASEHASSPLKREEWQLPVRLP